MFSILRKTAAPLSGLFLFVLGSGLFTTLIALRLHEAGAKPVIIGSMTAANYLGLMLGSFRMERFILRVGHIRAFAALASTLAVVSILHGLYLETYFWLGLRLIAGFVTAGLFVVIESWLLILGTVRTRGQILAIYMLSLYAAQASGQFLLKLATPASLTLYAIAGMTASLAVIPLAMMRGQVPQIEEPSSLNVLKLYRASPTGVLGTVCAGLILGTIYGLMPIYYVRVTNVASDVSWYMAAIIYGGMLLQYPIGKLSDYIDRRSVLVGVSLCTVLVAFGMIHLPVSHWILLVTGFLLGGLTFTLYPISISHACDVLAPEDIVAGTQGLVLTYSVGACLGPIIAPAFIHLFPHNGVFLYFIVICVFLAVFFFWRRIKQPSVLPTEQENFVSMPQTTAVVAELDPRSDET